MSNSDMTSSDAPPRYQRKLRNYLLDAGLQVRYTAFIIAVAVFLTVVLGYMIYDATRATSRAVELTTGVTDPVFTAELHDTFRAKDRVVIYGIAGFAVVLVLSIFASGIWITHKVAGPLYNMSRICARVRDNKLSPSLRQLRKGDELQEFYSSFRDMYEALRTRAAGDAHALATAITALEGVHPKPPAIQDAINELRELRRQKEQSLEGEA